MINIDMEKNNRLTVTSPFLPPLEEFLPYMEEIWSSKWLTNNGSFHQQLEHACSKDVIIRSLYLTMSLFFSSKESEAT